MSPTIYPDPRPEAQPDFPPAADSAAGASSVPAQPDMLPTDDETYESPFTTSAASARPAASSDPAFGYLIVLALSVGLMPLIPENSDLRYMILWMVMAGFGVLAWLLGNTTRIGQEAPENLLWGVVFGLIVALPLLMVGGDTLRGTDQRLFADMRIGAVLAYLVFVMPLAETLFLRGVLQEGRRFWLVGLLGSLWSALLFFPMLDVQRYPAVAVVIGVALLMMNLVYSYVRQRNGLAAAWVCQIVVNLTLLLLPLL